MTPRILLTSVLGAIAVRRWASYSVVDAFVGNTPLTLTGGNLEVRSTAERQVHRGPISNCHSSIVQNGRAFFKIGDHPRWGGSELSASVDPNSSGSSVAATTSSAKRRRSKQSDETASPISTSTTSRGVVDVVDDDYKDQVKDLVGLIQRRELDGDSASLDGRTLLYGAGAAAAVATLGLMSSLGLTPTDAVEAAQRFASSPQESLQEVIDSVQSMGVMGPVYFGLIYLVAEMLAIPATPLTMSAGYLFGMTTGVSVVLLAATCAASAAFFVGKTFLRDWVEGMLEENPKFAKIDKAVGKEGFKLLLLVRLSPIFPFSLSNYLYGASSINFPSYFWGTLLGFAPGTIAYVYTGMVGAALTVGGTDQQPWYVYTAGFTVLCTVLKLVTDVASQIIEAIDDEEEI